MTLEGALVVAERIGDNVRDSDRTATEHAVVTLRAEVIRLQRQQHEQMGQLKLRVTSNHAERT